MQNKLPRFLEILFKIFVLVSLAVLAVLFFFLNDKINKISSLPTSSSEEPSVSSTIPGQTLTRSDVETIVSTAISTLSGTTKIITSSPTPTSTPKADKIVFIPLGTTGNTQSTTWTDVPNAQVWLNFSGEYGPLARAWWDAFLRVDNANGTAYARLFDVTHSIAVNGSEISVSNTSSSTDVESAGNLQFWAGKNLYRVQIRSLNTSYVFFDFGRIKISY